jgi:hypothetical protein
MVDFEDYEVLRRCKHRERLCEPRLVVRGGEQWRPIPCEPDHRSGREQWSMRACHDHLSRLGFCGTLRTLPTSMIIVAHRAL